MKFSIIVPIYNVEKYLSTCLDSIAAQSFSDYECLLINDGSTDSSAHIADNFCSRFPKFRLLHKENGGLSDARNFGLSHAIGDYIIFIDSDDFIHLNYLEIVDNVCTTESPDLVYINYERVSESFQEIDYAYSTNKDASPISKDLLLQRPNFSWARVTKRNIFWNSPFPKGLLYEDIYVSALLASKVETIFQIHAPLYAYRRREGSITADSRISHALHMLKTVNLLWTSVKDKNLEKKFYTGILVNLTPSFAIVLIRNKSLKNLIFEANLVAEHYDRSSFLDFLKQTGSPKKKIAAFILSKKYVNVVALLFVRYFLSLFKVINISKLGITKLKAEDL